MLLSLDDQSTVERRETALAPVIAIRASKRPIVRIHLLAANGIMRPKLKTQTVSGRPGWTGYFDRPSVSLSRLGKREQMD